MKLTTTTFVSLDGVAQAPGGPDEDPSDGFALGGWCVPFVDEDFGARITEIFGHGDAFLFGRRTFEIMAAFWPQVTDPDDVVAARFNSRPKHVVSQTLAHADWAGTSIVRGDLRAAVDELKARPGDELQVHGSGRLVRSLHDLGLIDEYRVFTFPVVLGSGRRLFSDGAAPTSFELVDHERSRGGIAFSVLRPTGPVARGTVELQDGAEAMRPVSDQ
jgi:dihydrofolate reductase